MPVHRVVRLFAVSAIAVCTTSCLGVSRNGISVRMPLPASMVACLESRTIEWIVPTRAGQLTAAQVDTVGPRIRAIRAEPSALSQTVGDTIRLSEPVRMMALDSAGGLLGELPSYDFEWSGRGMCLLADGRFAFKRSGTTKFTARLSERHWRGRPKDRPAATVTIDVQ